MDVIKVGMADLAVCKAPQQLITTGLGSCVGICLYDPTIKIGGMAHIMLPDSTQTRNVTNKAKYADTAIMILIEEMIRLGALKSRLLGKIAGGAQMFNFAGSSNIMKIGERNAESARNLLKSLNIRLLVDDTGGSFGRTIKFNPENGELYIKTINHGEKIV